MLSPYHDDPGSTIEQRVIGLVQSGRRDEALGLIVPLFKRKVFALAFSFTHDRDEAEDLTQEVLVKVWKALPGFDTRAALSTWIYAITRNTSLSSLRRRRETADGERANDEQAGVTQDGENAVERMLLMRLIAALPNKQRQVVTLFYMQEHSHEEVSQMLDVPIGTVKTLLHRARERLRSEVER
jgi:RNA polymerase sigma-70 factor (ECF subfamily)